MRLVGNGSEVESGLWTVTCMPTSVIPTLCNPRLSLAFNHMQHNQLQSLAMLTRFQLQFMLSIGRREQASKHIAFFQLTTYPNSDDKTTRIHSSRWTTAYYDRSNVNNSRESRAGTLPLQTQSPNSTFPRSHVPFIQQRSRPPKRNSPNHTKCMDEIHV